MIVCDICGKNKIIKPYKLPMVEPWIMTHEGQYIYSYNKYIDKTVDLCETCAQAVADSISNLRNIRQKEN